jgi:fructuronate reductase
VTRLPAGQRPRVDRARLRPRVLHFGLGAFHRAHQAVYTEIANAKTGGDWGTVAVAPSSDATVQALRAQDHLYSVTDQIPDAPTTRVIGGLIGTLHAAADSIEIQRLIAAPDLAVVTLTITEKGYSRQPGSGRLDTADPRIAADLARCATPATEDAWPNPTGVIGHLAIGLIRRHRNGGAPLTIVSADNMTHNGPALRGVALDFLAECPWPAASAAAEWITTHVTFPETVVDRIVPATTDAGRAAATAALGLEDTMAVAGEPYRQWVLQDAFAAPRPRWELAGAQFVGDVAPFELTKLRLLNGAHSALAYLGLARGLATVDQAMNQTWAPRLVRQLAAEVGPTLPAGGPDPAAYSETLVERFSNPAMGHRLRQIGCDGSLKIPERWLGPLRELRNARRPAPVLTSALAAWAATTRLDAHGRQRFGVTDPNAEMLGAAWGGADRVAITRRLLHALGAADLAQDDALVRGVAARLDAPAAGRLAEPEDER